MVGWEVEREEGRKNERGRDDVTELVGFRESDTETYKVNEEREKGKDG